MMRMRGFLAFAVLLTLGSACRPAATVVPGMTEYRVASVRFEGVESVDRGDLADTLATQPNRFNPFAPVAYFNRFEFVADIDRIRTFYAEHGYFDAEVVDWDSGLNEAESEDQRKPRTHVTFTVVEGERTSLAADATYDISTLRSIEDPGSLFRDTELRAGTPFSREAVERERERIRRELMERSYARARVEARVYVDRERHEARVYFFFEPGIACVFGEIEVVGNRNIPANLIRRNTDIDPGESYRYSRLRHAQVELYDLDAFTSVEVEAILTPQRNIEADEAFQRLDDAMDQQGWAFEMHVADPPVGPLMAGLVDNVQDIQTADPVVPVRITVTESPSANYKFGGGLAIESSRTEAYGRSAAVWRNVLSPLNRAELEGRLGYAWLPTVFNRDTLASGIIGEIEGAISRPRVLFGIFDASLRLGFEHGVETDHEFSRPSIRVGISNRLSEFTRFYAGYQFEINLTRDFANAPVSPTTRSSCDRLPRAFRLGFFETGFRIERHDPAFERGRNDWAGSFNVQAGEGVAGDYPYLRADPEIRYYRQLTRRLSIATRAGAGIIYDYGEPVPRNQCLFLGGGSSVRGLPDRRIGPHQEEDIPTGGVASFLFNFEPRYMLSDIFGLVVFFDAGEVNSELAFDPSWGGDTGVAAAVGGGLRIYTPIGPVRADLGFRVTPVPSDHGRVRPVAFVISLGEAF